jgi:tetratricopeptide (TPR) repeat protein
MMAGRESLRTVAAALALACFGLAQAANDGDVRVLKVRVAADEIFRATPGWETLARQKLGVVSGIYARRFKLRFEVLDILEWRTGGETTVPETLWPRLVRDVPQGEADVLLGISDRKCAASAKTLGFGMILGSVALVMPACSHLSARSATFEQVLSHEIAHLFGAFHVRSHIRSVMTGDGPADFDSQTARIIQLFRDVDLRRGALGISAEQKRRYVEIFSESHPSGAPNPVAAAYRTLAHKVGAEGNDAGAAEILQQALEVAPTWGAVHGDLGVAHTRLNRPQEARYHYQRAIELGGSPGAEAQLAAADVARGGGAGSIEVLRQAAQRDPNSSGTQYALGQSLLMSGKPREAEPHLRRAIELDPNNYQAYDGLGTALGMQGRLPESAALLARSVELKPDFQPAWANLGYTLAQQGKLAEAIRHYREALRLNPNDTRTQVNLQRALARVNNPGVK